MSFDVIDRESHKKQPILHNIFWFLYILATYTKIRIKDLCQVQFNCMWVGFFLKTLIFIYGNSHEAWFLYYHYVEFGETCKRMDLQICKIYANFYPIFTDVISIEPKSMDLLNSSTVSPSSCNPKMYSKGIKCSALGTDFCQSFICL